MDYASYQTDLITLLSIQTSTDNNFQALLPAGIEYAEGRIYRETDLLATRVSTAGSAVSSGVRTFNLSTASGVFLVVESISLISSAGASAATGTRNPVVPTSRDFIDMTYPSATSSNCGLPEFFAMSNNTTVIFGPAPDAPYIAEVTGTQQPTPLSASNSSTILTQMLPDVFLAASMVFWSGFQQNFGAQGDNPQMAQSWEQQYQTL